MITKILFDTYRGRDVYLYELSNEEIKVGIIDFGAAIQYIKLNTPNGWRNVCLGFDNVNDYIASGTYCGATVGRVANRIRNAEFVLNGRLVKLTPNEGKNHHHGGSEGFDKKFYEAEPEENSLKLSLVSADGEQGYTGNLRLEAVFKICGAALDITYSAVSDGDTVWGPTCHAYFNLGEGNVGGVLLKINADKFTPIDEELIPTGETAFVEGTPFDFRELKPLGRDINEDNVQLRLAGGYDHSFILGGGCAAEAMGVESGIALRLYTSLPCMQLYFGKVSRGFCLEPQFCPNAVNMSGFDKPILERNIKKTYSIRFEFDK